MRKNYVLILFIIVSFAAKSQSGTLDTTFGDDGIVLTETSLDFNSAESIAVQTDGKIVVSGYARNQGGPTKMVVVRYNTDGSMDSSFGTNGILLLTDVGGLTTYATAVKIQGDGKIVLGGYTIDSSNTEIDLILVRLNADGTFDNTFGSNGVTIADFGDAELAGAMKIQDDGKIILAGWSIYLNSFLVTRFNSDGALDTTFGDLGRITVEFSNGRNGVARNLAIQNDGKIVIGGDVGPDSSNGYRLAVVRLNVDGTLDTTFGTSGKVEFNFGTDKEMAGGLAVQVDGKIFLGSQTIFNYLPEPNMFSLLKLNSDGTLDSSYGDNGVATAQIVDGKNNSNQILLQSDGKVILAGYTLIEDDYNIGMVRFDTNGNLDTTFGIDGKVSTDINGREDYAQNITLQTDNKILITGYSKISNYVSSIVVARYGNDVLETEDYQSVEFQLYPNPGRDEFTIKMYDASSTYQVEIYDMLGKKVFTTEIQQMGQIDVSALASGTYLVKLNSNSQTSTVRFVKQ